MLKMKRKMKEDQDWEPNKVGCVGCHGEHYHPLSQDDKKKPQQSLVEDVVDIKKKFHSTLQQRRKLWTFIAKKEIPKVNTVFLG